MFIFFVLSGKAEITYFKVIMGADEEILGFDISMDNIKTVKVGKSFNNLIDDFPN